MVAFYSLAWLIPLGFTIGVYGTLIGAGGGFVLVPILLVLYPQEEPEIIASISLAVVFFNAASGSWAYARMKRIDYRAATVFSFATMPGAVLGALTTTYLARSHFDLLLGACLLLLCAYLSLRPGDEGVVCGRDDQSSREIAVPNRFRQLSVGSLLSAVVGYVSTLLGVGGGVIHVPVMIRVLRFPVHVATATSHLILAVMSLTGTVVHILDGGFQHGVRRTIALSIGVVVGAQVGARLSARLHGDWIVRGLTIGLALLGLRLVYVGLS